MRPAGPSRTLPAPDVYGTKSAVQSDFNSFSRSTNRSRSVSQRLLMALQPLHVLFSMRAWVGGMQRRSMLRSR